MWEVSTFAVFIAFENSNAKSKYFCLVEDHIEFPALHIPANYIDIHMHPSFISTLSDNH